ncbi:MAG: SUMF1/EgtB/PvdO family nonheme iron enzyme [Nitrosomonas sp.]|uniref:SUMF1/EgtB/PvdO family nonheme iron enzyme n=1 Tax=Nitrosomonas sp. TaxID=42353 RepID=UPI0027301692|nr:SUMF1/EgtB/PvdO family nonheme iron enzyme [Nitrosomonas sp.]MDP1786028.1 SUMF1/EgtB/PvdO family nonheme iron enzyme [Nitrosomonas sp.]MDP2223334.1 SUMF1/EgtB/PvdO family nonheme iron enzyme [Nitrosomonas sp.]MDP3280059.1 SUMF1/EgtB/PvdO family nonheme iron enzyme [Nitrosomonas sp.]
MHAARAVVVLWSAASRDSDFVLEEAEYGKCKDILFPAFIERVECPYEFGRIQTADLIEWNHQLEHAGLVQLLASLRVHLNGAGTEPLHSAAPIQSVLKPGQTFRDPLQSGGEGPLLTVIPAGRFVMGSPEDEHGRAEREGPQHEVIIAQPFALGVYAVTFSEYDRFCEATGKKTPDDNDWGRENRPVINVSWHDAQAYCGWLSNQTGQSYRLPSEAEWEYACRAGTTTPFNTGEKINSEQANFDIAHDRTLSAGSFPSNKFGLYDMHGNVLEWAQDCWHENYRGAPNDGSAWLEANGGNCDRRVVRGGSWYLDPLLLRSAFRYGDFSDAAGVLLGFRIARAF